MTPRSVQGDPDAEDLDVEEVLALLVGDRVLVVVVVVMAGLGLGAETGVDGAAGGVAEFGGHGLSELGGQLGRVPAGEGGLHGLVDGVGEGGDDLVEVEGVEGGGVLGGEVGRRGGGHQAEGVPDGTHQTVTSVSVSTVVTTSTSSTFRDGAQGFIGTGPRPRRLYVAVMAARSGVCREDGVRKIRNVP